MMGRLFATDIQGFDISVETINNRISGRTAYRRYEYALLSKWVWSRYFEEYLLCERISATKPVDANRLILVQLDFNVRSRLDAFTLVSTPANKLHENYLQYFLQGIQPRVKHYH